LPPALAGGKETSDKKALAKLTHLAKATNFIYKNLQLKLEAIENQTLSKFKTLTKLTFQDFEI
jgi:hypothetical protein